MADFAQEFFSIVQAGGVLMFALAGLAIFIYWIAIDTLTKFPWSSAALVDRTLRELKGIDADEFRIGKLQFIRGRRNLLQVLTAAAPLLGLLGTVMGMLTTFRGLTQSNGDIFDQIAAGISEAMITTETGLVISIPALFLLMFIDARISGLEHAIAKHEWAEGKT